MENVQIADMAPQAVEEELQRILKASGIGSSPIDPSSLEFLRQQVKDRRRLKPSPSKSIQPRSGQDASIWPRKAYFGTNGHKPKPAESSGTVSDASDCDAYTAQTTTSQVPTTPDTALILEQLTIQTNLILSLQDKVQVLTEKVYKMEASGSNAMEQQQQQQRGQQLQEEDVDAAVGRVRIFEPQGRYIPPPGNVPGILRFGMFGNNNRPPPVVGPPELHPGVLAWFVETTRLFLVLSRDYARPLDGALLFKLLFMTMVVISRFNKNSSQTQKDPKILLLLGILMMGFLFHTRYIQYVYQFFWKQNVPARVWKGEQNITLLPPAAEENGNWDNNNNGNGNDNNQEDRPPEHRNPVPPRLRGGEDANAPAARWWHRNDMLLGGVAPIDNNAQGAPTNPIVAVVNGIYYLVGSFIFSLFPMWNPRGHQQRRPLVEERLDDAASQDGIPEVRAPRDAMEAADDENERAED